MGLILDTNFLIAAEREGRRGMTGRTGQFFASHLSEKFFVTFAVAGELACGRSAATWQGWQQLFQPYPVLPWSLEISWHYGEIYRELQSTGMLIGSNDL